MDRFISSMQKKIKLAFSNSVELVRWMNLTGRETVKPEEFYFAI